jgi:hypothetical protein
MPIDAHTPARSIRAGDALRWMARCVRAEARCSGEGWGAQIREVENGLTNQGVGSGWGNVPDLGARCGLHGGGRRHRVLPEEMAEDAGVVVRRLARVAVLAQKGGVHHSVREGRSHRSGYLDDRQQGEEEPVQPGRPSHDSRTMDAAPQGVNHSSGRGPTPRRRRKIGLRLVRGVRLSARLPHGQWIESPPTRTGTPCCAANRL